MKMTEFLVKHFVKNYEKVSDVEVRTAYGILASFVGIGCNLILFAETGSGTGDQQYFRYGRRI